MAPPVPRRVRQPLAAHLDPWVIVILSDAGIPNQRGAQHSTAVFGHAQSSLGGAHLRVGHNGHHPSAKREISWPPNRTSLSVYREITMALA